MVKLVYIKDLVKICPKCGRKYPEDYNYCTIHDVAIELAYIKDLVKACTACGAKYPKDYNYCIRCEWDEPLEIIDEDKRNIKIKDIKFTPDFNRKKYPNTFKELDELLSDENILKLKHFNFNQSDFDDILLNIHKTYKNNLNHLIDEYVIDFNSLNILDKMILFAKSFVKIDYKDVGGDLGHFEFNKIHVDDRLDYALQISTIIHELAHFILSEITEEIVQRLLNCNKTEPLQAFVLYTLTHDIFNEVADEFCAHTVEGRYIPFGYQDYSSYRLYLEKFCKSNHEELAEIARLAGNTFAFYIKTIISTFIDDEIRNEIKEEYGSLKDSKHYDEVLHETDRYLAWDEFRECLKFMLTRNIDEYVNNFDDIEKIYLYSVRFSQNK